MNLLLILVLLTVGMINIIGANHSKFINYIKVNLLFGVSIFIKYQLLLESNDLTSSPMYLRVFYESIPEILCMIILFITYIVFEVNSLNKNKQE